MLRICLLNIYTYRFMLNAYAPLISVNLHIIFPLYNALKIINFITSHASYLQFEINACVDVRIHGFQTHEDTFNFSLVLSIHILTCSNKHRKIVSITLQTTHAKCVD
jgi:hypothetical protein